jgi:hypothetical protein
VDELLRAGAKKPQAKRFLFNVQKHLDSVGPTSTPKAKSNQE